MRWCSGGWLRANQPCYGCKEKVSKNGLNWFISVTPGYVAVLPIPPGATLPAFNHFPLSSQPLTQRTSPRATLVSFQLKFGRARHSFIPACDKMPQPDEYFLVFTGLIFASRTTVAMCSPCWLKNPATNAPATVCQHPFLVLVQF